MKKSDSGRMNTMYKGPEVIKREHCTSGSTACESRNGRDGTREVGRSAGVQGLVSLGKEFGLLNLECLDKAGVLEESWWLPWENDIEGSETICKNQLEGFQWPG